MFLRVQPYGQLLALIPDSQFKIIREVKQKILQSNIHLQSSNAIDFRVLVHFGNSKMKFLTYS